MTEAFKKSILPYLTSITAKKAENVIVLDVRSLTSYSDALIIASAKSNRQVAAIGEHIRRELRKQMIKPIGVEGLGEGQWVLIDYGHVVIHIFYDDVREFYNLEGLWKDAKRLEFN